MERQTKTIKLPITGFTVEYYSYITAGEKRQITEIMTSTMSANVSGQVTGDIPLSLVYKSNDKALELLIKNIDGKTDEVLSTVTNLPSTDYDFLLSEINKVSSDSDYQEKKTT
jgi:hypothetical protein